VIGVEPDVKVSSAEALEAAKNLATDSTRRATDSTQIRHR